MPRNASSTSHANLEHRWRTYGDLRGECHARIFSHLVARRSPFSLDFRKAPHMAPGDVDSCCVGTYSETSAQCYTRTAGACLHVYLCLSTFLITSGTRLHTHTSTMFLFLSYPAPIKDTYLKHQTHASAIDKHIHALLPDNLLQGSIVFDICFLRRCMKTFNFDLHCCT